MTSRATMKRHSAPSTAQNEGDDFVGCCVQKEVDVSISRPLLACDRNAKISSSRESRMRTLISCHPYACMVNGTSFYFFNGNGNGQLNAWALIFIITGAATVIITMTCMCIFAIRLHYMYRHLPRDRRRALTPVFPTPSPHPVVYSPAVFDNMPNLKISESDKKPDETQESQ